MDKLIIATDTTPGSITDHKNHKEDQVASLKRIVLPLLMKVGPQQKENSHNKHLNEVSLHFSPKYLPERFENCCSVSLKLEERYIVLLAWRDTDIATSFICFNDTVHYLKYKDEAKNISITIHELTRSRSW